MEQFSSAGLTVERWRVCVDRAAFDIGCKRAAAIDRLAEGIEQPAENRLANRRSDRPSASGRPGSSSQPGGVPECNGTDQLGTQMVLYFDNERPAHIPPDLHRLVDRRKLAAPEGKLDDGAVNGGDGAPILIG